MCGLTDILTSSKTPNDLRESYVPLAVRKMVQLSAEKIGRTRETACNCIFTLLHNPRTKDIVPRANILISVYKNAQDFIQVCF